VRPVIGPNIRLVKYPIYEGKISTKQQSCMQATTQPQPSRQASEQALLKAFF